MITVSEGSEKRARGADPHKKQASVSQAKTTFSATRIRSIRLAHFLSLVQKPVFCYTFLHWNSQKRA